MNRWQGKSTGTLAVVLGGLVWTLGCSEHQTAATAPAPVARPVVEPAVLARGEALFKKHCAACHGDRAQGAIAWERPGPDGKYPPPPLNGTAHDWHHPREQLQRTIREGTLRIGGSMPPWGTTLTDADIDSIITWFQSLWPDPVYAAWVDIDRRARAGEGGR